MGQKSALIPARTLPKLGQPLLWISGRRDDPQSIAPAALKRVPANARSQRLAFDADLADLPGMATTAILRWLNTLSPE